MFIDKDDLRARTASAAVQAGDDEALASLLGTYPELATAYIGSATEARTLLHILADWPGHIANGPVIARILLAANADVNAPFVGVHSETPLHWAASNNDTRLLDTLLDGGADINAKGGVINETPLADARAFLQLETAQRLVERGANVTLQDASTLGFLGRVKAFFDSTSQPSKATIDCALWNACHGNQLAVAQYLHEKGGDANYVPPWEILTPLNAARRSNATDVRAWLEEIGAVTVQNLHKIGS